MMSHDKGIMDTSKQSKEGWPFQSKGKIEDRLEVSMTNTRMADVWHILY